MIILEKNLHGIDIICGRYGEKSCKWNISSVKNDDKKEK